jgi:hypothetical protein
MISHTGIRFGPAVGTVKRKCLGPLSDEWPLSMAYAEKWTVALVYIPVSDNPSNEQPFVSTSVLDRFTSFIGATRSWLGGSADSDPGTAAPIGRQSADFSVPGHSRRTGIERVGLLGARNGYSPRSQSMVGVQPQWSAKFGLDMPDRGAIGNASSERQGILTDVVPYVLDPATMKPAAPKNDCPFRSISS